LVAGAAEGLQVADVVAAAAGEGDDMIDRQLGFLFGLAATLALVFIAIEYVFSDFWWNGDSGSFTHELFG
jgi:hypothetical protein